MIFKRLKNYPRRLHGLERETRFFLQKYLINISWETRIILLMRWVGLGTGETDRAFIDMIFIALEGKQVGF